MFAYAYYAYISYKQTSFVRSISLNLLWYFEIWNHKKKVKNAVLLNAGPLSSVLEKDRKRFVNLTEEIFSWRCYLRQSEYLFNVPISITGRVLTDDMVNFTVKVQSIRKRYWSSVAAGVPLQNVRTVNLKVLQDIEMDEIKPYQPYTLEEEEE